MCSSLLAPHPFGEQITVASLTERFSHFHQWEDRYRQLIQLSRQLQIAGKTRSVIDSSLGTLANISIVSVWWSSNLAVAFHEPVAD